MRTVSMDYIKKRRPGEEVAACHRTPAFRAVMYSNSWIRNEEQQIQKHETTQTHFSGGASVLNAGRAGLWPHEAWVHSSWPESPLLLWKPQSTWKTLTCMANPNEQEKPCLREKPYLNPPFSLFLSLFFPFFLFLFFLFFKKERPRVSGASPGWSFLEKVWNRKAKNSFYGV